jgi:tetratricopeptide (TPR) repeat protein
LVYATRGVNLAQQVKDRDRLGRMQTRLGDVRLALGDANAAIDTYTHAVESLRGSENWLTIGTVMSKLGNAYLEQGKAQEAVMMLEQALTMFRKEHNSDYEARTLGSIGGAYAALKQWAQAQDRHEQALKLAREQHNQIEEVEQLSALAHLREVQSDPAGVVRYYRQALHVAYQLDDNELVAPLAFDLGRLLIDDTRTLLQAVQLLTESDSLIPNNEAKRLLARANKRVERTQSAGMSLPAVEGSNSAYAAAAYDMAEITDPPSLPR